MNIKKHEELAKDLIKAAFESGDLVEPFEQEIAKPVVDEIGPSTPNAAAYVINYLTAPDVSSRLISEAWGEYQGKNIDDAEMLHTER